MRKMFTRLFGLTLLMYLSSALTVVKAQTSPKDITDDNIELVTDISTVCDDGLVQYQVVGYESDSTYYNFNGMSGDPGSGGFTKANTFTTIEGHAFTVQVKVGAWITKEYPYTPGADEKVATMTLDSIGLTHPTCWDDEGELTLYVSGNQAFKSYYVDSLVTGGWDPNSTTYTKHNETQFLALPGHKYYVGITAEHCTNVVWDSVKVADAPMEIEVDSIFVDAGDSIDCIGGTGIVTVWVTPGGGVPYSSGEYKVQLLGPGIDSTKMTSSLEATFMVPAGDYTAIAIDSVGCESAPHDSTATLVDPAAITFDISLEDIACADSTDGTILVHNFGGNLADSVFLAYYGADTMLAAVEIPANDTVEFANLKVGYYSVWVGNMNGCDPIPYNNPNYSGGGDANVISLQAPTAIEVSVTTVASECFGDSSEISVTATGGSGNYLFQLEKPAGSVLKPFSTTSTWKVGANQPGVYAVAVQDADAGSCYIYAENPVVFDTLVAVELVSVDSISPSCPGGTDGAIKINATAAAGRTLMYSIDSMTWYTNNLLTVGPGDYMVYVKDDVCDSVLVDSITVEALDTNMISIVYAGIDTLNQCHGVNSNTFTVNVDSWASQMGVDRDVNIIISDEMFVGGDTAVVTGVAGNSITATNLDPGMYYIWAVDNYGCVFDGDLDGTADYLTITIDENPELSVEGWESESATCFGSYDGVMTITTSVPVEFIGRANTLAAALALSTNAMNHYPAGVDSVTQQVGAGSYWLVAIDFCGERKYSEEIVIGSLPKMVAPAELDVEDNVCNGDTSGVIEVSAATGGSEDFTYTLQENVASVWTDVVGYVDVTSTMFENLKAGTYRVVATDAVCGDIVSKDIVVDQPANPVVLTVVSVDDISCNGAGDGLIKIKASGGVGNYQFKVGSTSWRPFPSDTATVKQIVVTEVGTWDIMVRDSVMCESNVETVDVDEPAAIVLTVKPTKNTSSCSQPDNGELEITVTGGRPGVDYTIQVNDSILPNAADSAIAMDYIGLAGGTYTVTATEIGGNGCEVTELAKVGAPDSIAFDVVVLDSVHCRGGDDGIVVVSNIVGGTAPYYTTISGPVAGTKDSTATAITFNDLIVGNYTITVTDAAGCSLVEGVSISEPDTIVLKATWISDITCAEGGKFSIQATGGSGEFLYFAAKSKLPAHVLVPDPMASDAWQSDSIFMVDEAATYIVWAYDEVNGCLVGGEDLNGVAINAWRVVIGEPSIVVDVNAKVDGNTACYGAMFDITVPADSIMITKNGVAIPSPVYTVAIDTVMADSLMGVGPGTYVVTVTHESGCSGTDTVVIAQQEVFEVMLDKGAGEFTCPDVVEGYIEANVVSGGGDTLEYQLWQGNVMKTDFQPVNSFLVKIGFDYTVVVRDELGCTDTSNVLELDPVQEADFEIKDVTCYSDTMASAKVIVTGEPGREFKLYWEELETGKKGETAFFSETTVLSQMFEFDEKNTTDRHYEMYVKDNMMCESARQTLTFKRVDGPLQVVNTQGVVGDCSSEFSFEIAGGTAPYMVMIDSTVVADSIGFYQRISVDLFGGSHNVYVFDAQECELVYNFDVAFGTVVYDTVSIYEGDTVEYTMYGQDTMLVAGDYEFVIADSACAAQLFVNVNERPRTAPVLDNVTPNDTIADNHPTFVITFTDDVMLNDSVMGYIWVFQKDSMDAVLQIPIDASMINGNTVTIDYDHTVYGGLDKNTTYVVKVDSGAIMGDGLVWDGIMDDSWMFTTGPDFKVGITPEVDLNSFKVYPNPFNNFIRIDNADKLDRVVVLNIAGQRVLDIENPSYEIRTGNLVTGVYVVTLISNNEIVKSERIIKR